MQGMGFGMAAIATFDWRVCASTEICGNPAVVVTVAAVESPETFVEDPPPQAATVRMSPTPIEKRVLLFRTNALLPCNASCSRRIVSALG